MRVFVQIVNKCKAVKKAAISQNRRQPPWLPPIFMNFGIACRHCKKY